METVLVTAIAACWSFTASPDVERRCQRMLTAQQMYGEGRPVCWSGGGVALGRSLFRLLPEDLHDRGPIEEQGDVLVADVRLDNRGDLHAALGLNAAEAARLPDAAILMRCLRRWDEDALQRMVGDFAFALWRPREQKLLLVRDPMGQRPLVYHRGADFIAVATMAKGLHALAEVPHGLNKQKMADFLALMPESDSQTFFQDVEKVRPGHVVTVTPGGIASRRYWTPSNATLRLAKPADYEEAVREQLDRAVAARLRGAGDAVGAHLSGGLDSGAVAATAARHLAGRGSVFAYTAVPREGWAGRAAGTAIADEGPLADAVAALYPNIRHFKVQGGAVSPLDLMERYFLTHERPVLNPCNAVWSNAILEDAKARGLKVMLTGQAGNMSFSYDGMALLSLLLREGRLVQLGKAVFALLREGARAGTIAAQTFGPFLPRPVWRNVARMRGKGRKLTDYTAINPAHADAVTERAKSRGLDVSYRPRQDPFELRMWVLERVDFGNYNKGALGAWGVDVRDPTADRRLVELCLAIPPAEYLRGGIPRSLARRALADRLPAAVLGERRKGYQAADWHEGLSAARPQLDEELDRLARIPEAADLLDIARLRRLLDDWPDGGWHRDAVIEEYRLALLRGASAGSFIRKATGTNV
jgi:asparagine synthase (glutamine-hydrolysing)